MKLSELLVNIIPSAEMVRFGKNGSDATTAAIRLARAFTNRDLIAVAAIMVGRLVHWIFI